MVLGRNYVERATRYKIDLNAPIVITAASNSTVNKEPFLTLNGQILDISLSGLALIISYYEMRELKRLESEWMMRLLLPLPKKAIELEAAPVRYQRLDEAIMGRILLGARITNINEPARVLFGEFLRECETLQRT